MKSRTELTKEFNDLKTDKEKWQWVLKNQDKGITIYCDNDDTYGLFDNGDPEADELLRFDWYIGWPDGVFYLLEAMGINAESV